MIVTPNDYYLFSTYSAVTVYILIVCRPTINAFCVYVQLSHLAIQVFGVRFWRHTRQQRDTDNKQDKHGNSHYYFFGHHFINSFGYIVAAASSAAITISVAPTSINSHASLSALRLRRRRVISALTSPVTAVVCPMSASAPANNNIVSSLVVF